MRGAAGWGENDAVLMAKRVLSLLVIDSGGGVAARQRVRGGDGGVFGSAAGCSGAGSAQVGHTPGGGGVWRRVEKRREEAGGGGRKAVLPVNSRID